LYYDTLIDFCAFSPNTLISDAHHFFIISPLFVDPNYSGFNTLADDLKLSAPEVLRSRRAHYETGTEVGLQFMRDYIGSRNEFYNNKEENRTTMKRGAAFFVATCLLDWAVCVL